MLPKCRRKPGFGCFLRVLRVARGWALDCNSRGRSAVVRITVRGMLIFCSLLAGLVAAEVMAAPGPAENVSGGVAPDVLWLA